MYSKQGSAADFALSVLREHYDRELQVGELHELSDNKFTKGNINNACNRLLAEGLLERVNDDNRTAWWAVTAKGIV